MHSQEGIEVFMVECAGIVLFRVLVRQWWHGWHKGEAFQREAPSAANQPAADRCSAWSRQAQGSGQVTQARALRRRVRATTSRARAGEFAHSMILLLMLAKPVRSGHNAVNVRIMLDQQVVPDVLRQWCAMLTHSSHGCCLFMELAKALVIKEMHDS